MGSCTASRIIMAIVSPLIILNGVQLALITKEQFGLRSALDEKPICDVDGPEFHLGQCVFHSFTKLTVFKLDEKKFAEEVTATAKATPKAGGLDLGTVESPAMKVWKKSKTKGWVETIIGNTSLHFLDQINDQFVQQEKSRGQLMQVKVSEGAVLKSFKLALAVAGVFNGIKALCLLLAGIAAAITGCCVAKKNGCLKQLVQTPMGIYVMQCVLFLLFQFISSDYMSDLKNGKAYFPVPELPLDVSTTVYIYLPVSLVLGLLVLFSSCCACHPEDEEEQSMVQHPYAPQYRNTLQASYQPVHTPFYAQAPQPYHPAPYGAPQPMQPCGVQQQVTHTVEEERTTFQPVGGAVMV